MINWIFPELALQRCNARTVFSSRRAVNTVTTTARWEGRTTPTLLCPPATACSKWTAASHSCCLPLLLLTLYCLPCLPFAPLSAPQWDVWWWSSYVSNRTLTTDSFNREFKMSTSSAIKYVSSTQFFPFNPLEYFSRKQLQGLTE